MKHVALGLLAFFLCARSMAQSEIVVEATRQLSASLSTNPGVRPLVFFSQDKYAPGDTAFFRVFILTESKDALQERSLFTMLLINQHGKPVIKQVVACQPFGAANQLVLPEHLEPGNYEVRFFSDRMTSAYGFTTSLLVAGPQRLERASPAEATITFHPEGGNLVPDVLNRVVIRSSGPSPVSATLTGSEGRILEVEFKQGLASAYFVPKTNQEYFLEYGDPHARKKVPLPRALPGSMTLRVYPGPKKAQVIEVLSGPAAPREVTLFLIANRQVLHSQRVRVGDSGKSSILAASDFFPEGYAELYLVDESLRPLSFRPVYSPPAPKAVVSFADLPDQVTARKDLGVSVSVTDELGQPLRSSLAVSIIPDDVRRGAMRTPDPTLELRTEQPRFDWELALPDRELGLLSASQMPVRMVPDYPVLLYNANLSLSGRVYSPIDLEPLPYLSKIIIYLHTDRIQYETAVDGNGNFHFDKIYDFMGEDLVFYKVVNSQGQTVRARVDWTTNLGDEGAIAPEQFNVTDAEDAYGVIRSRKRVIDQSFRYFLDSSSANFKSNDFNSSLELEFGTADISIRPGEYVPFETMRELVMEVIPSLKFRTHGKDSILEVSLVNNDPAFVAMRYAEGPPLCIIDGFMTANLGYVMSLSPRDIEVVKIINEISKLNKLQNLARDGILFIQTKYPERTRKDLENELHPISGLSPTLSFQSNYPAHKRVPDLRSLLYWTPHQDTDSMGKATIKCRTSDLPGIYWIRVTGVTATGHLFTAEKRFEVKFK